VLEKLAQEMKAELTAGRFRTAHAS